MRRGARPSRYLLEVRGMPIEVSRKRVKNMNLRISREGKISLSVPLWCTEDDARAFLVREEGWIAEHLAKVAARNAALAQESYRDGDKTMLWGEPFRLEMHVEDRQAPENAVFPLERRIELKVPASFLISADGVPAVPRSAIDSVRADALSRVLGDLAAFAEGRVGVHAASWQVRTMKTRWGSCSTKTRRIRLASELAAYPYQCAQEVACHEACHLLVPNHSAAFYAELSRALPDWKEAADLLKKLPHQR